MSFAHGLRPEFRFPNGLYIIIIVDEQQQYLHYNIITGFYQIVVHKLPLGLVACFNCIY